MSVDAVSNTAGSTRHTVTDDGNGTCAECGRRLAYYAGKLQHIRGGGAIVDARRLGLAVLYPQPAPRPLRMTEPRPRLVLSTEPQPVQPDVEELRKRLQNIQRVSDRFDRLDEQLATLETDLENIIDRLGRIESKLNGFRRRGTIEAA